MTEPGSPVSVTTAMPAASHACMPPARLTASYPRWRRTAAVLPAALVVLASHRSENQRGRALTA